jgi:acyl carrier protein
MKGPRLRPDLTRVDVMAQIAEKIRAVSARARHAAIAPQSRLSEDLALDSLDLVAVLVELQDHFGVEIDLDEASGPRRVADLAATLSAPMPPAARTVRARDARPFHV